MILIKSLLTGVSVVHSNELFGDMGRKRLRS